MFFFFFLDKKICLHSKATESHGKVKKYVSSLPWLLGCFTSFNRVLLAVLVAS